MPSWRAAAKRGPSAAAWPLRAGEAAEQQGQDHAGVASGAPEKGAGHSLSRISQILGLVPLHFGSGGTDRQTHIGASVPVGNGEHI